MGNGEWGMGKAGRPDGGKASAQETAPTIPDSRLPAPGYFAANRTAPSRRIVSPLR